MKINFKQPKYVLPAIAFPFLFLFFYVWHSSNSKKKETVKTEDGLKGTVGNVSSTVRKKVLADKLDAFRNTYKDGGGISAVNAIPKETTANPGFKDNYSGKERQTLDSIDRAMKAKFNQPQTSNKDQELAAGLNRMAARQKQRESPPPAKEKDPMDFFKQQMAYMDSVQKLSDPAYKADQVKKKAAEKAAQLKVAEVEFTVVKADEIAGDFNTLKPPSGEGFIKAIIDENVTGYAGSRLRLILLDDIRAGNCLVKKGTYLFPRISGFSEQRVTLSITSILYENRILPVKLEIYDLDGMPGLYVPSSAFRDFTKDLGSSSVQGVTLDGSGGSQFIMSSVDKLFQSTSSAIAEIIRKNKAKMKYGSYIYLIDPSALQSAQKSY